MRQPFARTLALSLALGAMLLRGLMPSGWMPNTETSGSLFTICSVDGAHTSGKAPSDPASERSHAPCAFAAAAHLAPPVLDIGGFIAPALAQRLVFSASSSPVAHQSLYRPNAARAPPAFS